MWLKSFANYLLGKRINAMWLVLVLCLLPSMLASLACIILGLVTLCKGAKEGFLLLLWAILPFVVKAYVDHSLLLALLPVISFTGVWLGALLLKWYSSWSILLRYCGMFGVLCVVTLHLIFPDIVTYWAQHIFLYFQEMTKAMGTDPVSQQQVMVVALVATGVQVLLVIISVSFKLMMARWWQALVFNPGGLRKELYQIRIDNVTLGLFFALVIAVVFKSTVAIDAIVPLFGVFAAAGLSLLHCSLRGHKYGFGLLVLFYLIAVISPYIMIAPMMAAMADKWFNFRSRIGNQ